MERRDFLRTGLAFGVASLSGVELLRDTALASARNAGGVIRLNSNENPLGLSPAARQAVIDGLNQANRYPDASKEAVVEALAAAHGIKPDNLVLGAGSTEVLQMSVQALGSPSSPLVVADPTFEDVPRYAQPFPWRLKKVPLDHRHAHDLERMRVAAESWGGRAMVYICNPNNPTGTLTPSAEIDAWIEKAPPNIFFLIDEAYYEYVQDPAYWSCLKWVEAKPNVIVVRTFSKIYGMAGMRLGYGMAHPETAAELRRFMSSSSANHLANVAGLASLADSELIARGRAANSEGMQIVYDICAELDLAHLPSHTNFVMHRVNGDLAAYRARMLEYNIKVGRPFPPMLTYNRLSIGTPQEMGQFAEILREFRKKGWA